MEERASSSGPALGESEEVRIRPFEAADQDAVLDLLQVGFGKWPRQVDGADPKRFFRWKHFENPFGESMLLVATVGEKVVGFAAWLRWRLSAGGRSFDALRGVDFVVDPAYRRRRVPLSLILAAQECFPAETALTFSQPNQGSRPGALRSGRAEVGDLPRYARPAPLCLLRGGGRRAVAPQGNAAADTAAEVLGDDALSDLVASQPQDGSRLSTAKDLAFLRWRYGQVGDYYAVRTDSRGELGGLAIFRRATRGRTVLARVVELLVRDGDPEITRRVLRGVRTALPAGVTVCCFPSARTAARCGFLPVRKGYYVVAQPLHEDLDPDPTRRASWELSLGDLEVL